MKEFNKWFANITKEYPLYQDKDGYNIGNTPALKVGWKAALEWAKNMAHLYAKDSELEDILLDELEE